MKPRTGDGPLEVTKEGRGIVMRVPLEGGGRLVVEMTPDEATGKLNVRIPLIARNLLGSIHLLSTTCRLFADKCVSGIEANEEGCRRSAESTLAAATALNPHIGYDKAGHIVKTAAETGRHLREVALEHGVDEDTYEKAMDLRRIARGSAAHPDAEQS